MRFKDIAIGIFFAAMAAIPIIGPFGVSVFLLGAKKPKLSFFVFIIAIVLAICLFSAGEASSSIFIILNLFLIFFTAQFFYKYSRSYNSELENISTEEPQQTINPSFSCEPTSDRTLDELHIEFNGECLKINLAKENEMIEFMGITSIQAQYIANDKANNGDFVDFRDFVTRSKLRGNFCRQFEDKIDFTPSRNA